MVGAEKVQMSVIDVTQLFSLGLVGVVHRWGGTMLEDIEGATMIEATLGFIGIHWEMGWGSWNDAESSTVPKDGQD